MKMQRSATRIILFSKCKFIPDILPMKALKLFQVLSLVSLAAFTGAFLFIAMVMVPFWLSSQPDYFLEWFKLNFFRFPSLMVPLNLIALLTTLITLAVSWKSAANTKFNWIIVAIAVFLASITYPIYFASANASFLAKTMELQIVLPTIVTWSRWNWLRLGLTIIALVLATISVYQFKEE
jgi:hypothetical protein